MTGEKIASEVTLVSGGEDGSGVYIDGVLFPYFVAGPVEHFDSDTPLTVVLEVFTNRLVLSSKAPTPAEKEPRFVAVGGDSVLDRETGLYARNFTRPLARAAGLNSGDEQPRWWTWGA